MGPFSRRFITFVLLPCLLTGTVVPSSWRAEESFHQAFPTFSNQALAEEPGISLHRSLLKPAVSSHIKRWIVSSKIGGQWLWLRDWLNPGMPAKEYLVQRAPLWQTLVSTGLGILTVALFIHPVDWSIQQRLVVAIAGSYLTLFLPDLVHPSTRRAVPLNSVIACTILGISSLPIWVFGGWTGFILSAILFPWVQWGFHASLLRLGVRFQFLHPSIASDHMMDLEKAFESPLAHRLVNDLAALSDDFLYTFVQPVSDESYLREEGVGRDYSFQFLADWLGAAQTLLGKYTDVIPKSTHVRLQGLIREVMTAKNARVWEAVKETVEAWNHELWIPFGGFWIGYFGWLNPERVQVLGWGWSPSNRGAFHVALFEGDRGSKYHKDSHTAFFDLNPLRNVRARSLAIGQWLSINADPSQIDFKKLDLTSEEKEIIRITPTEYWRDYADSEKALYQQIWKTYWEEWGHGVDKGFVVQHGGGDHGAQRAIIPGSALHAWRREGRFTHLENDVAEIAAVFRHVMWALSDSFLFEILVSMAFSDPKDADHHPALMFVFAQLRSGLGLPEDVDVKTILAAARGLGLPAMRLMAKKLFHENLKFSSEGGGLPSLSEDGTRIVFNSPLFESTLVLIRHHLNQPSRSSLHRRSG